MKLTLLNNEYFKKMKTEKLEPRVIWIHCNYDPRRLGRCLDLAETFLKKLKLQNNSVLLYVDNNPENMETEQREPWIRLRGTNQAREFSAWKEGWEAAGDEAKDIDLVILTNDTFPFHQPFTLLGPLLRWKLKKLIENDSENFALGVVERGLDYQNLSEYITSFFIVLDRRAAILAMPSITTPAYGWHIANDTRNGKIFLSEDKKYESNMNKWLLSRSFHSWYAARPLNEKNFGSLAGKAKSIILEHSLSRNLQTNGVQLISCFDFSLGFLARWYMRLAELGRKVKNSQ